MKNNYITIQGWMVTEFGLSSNNLLCYALIYGFSQDGETEFSGSINYLCKWLNCSKPTAIKTLKDLVEKGLIEKKSVIKNSITFNSYKVILGDGKEILLPVKNESKNDDLSSKETLLGSKETLPNINNNNNNINNNIINIHPLQNFILKNCPNISKLKNQLTFEQCEKLLKEFPNHLHTKEIFEAMENFKDLPKKYNSVYLTFRNWIKIRRRNDENFGKITQSKDLKSWN